MDYFFTIWIFFGPSVYNVDETNVLFSQQTPYTYAQRGSRTVAVKSVNSSSRCTTMLGGSMSGKKLAPFIIFKGTNKPSGYIRREVRERERELSGRYGIRCSSEGLDG